MVQLGFSEARPPRSWRQNLFTSQVLSLVWPYRSCKVQLLYFTYYILSLSSARVYVECRVCRLAALLSLSPGARAAPGLLFFIFILTVRLSVTYVSYTGHGQTLYSVLLLCLFAL